MILRGSLFRKYAILFVALVSGALLVSGLLETYFSYRENRDALVALEQEKALGAAATIAQFVKAVEQQIGWTTQPPIVAPAAAMEQRRSDYFRLLRQVLQSHQTVIRFFGQTQHIVRRAPELPNQKNPCNSDNSGPR